jgi:hypothetical protein
VTVVKPGVTPAPVIKPYLQEEPTGLAWEGQVAAPKWRNCYTKVRSQFAASKGLSLSVRFELDGDGPISQQKIEETKVALRKLGRDDQLITQ